ncbi:hypothetical protein NDU88_002648 [Pleurodeles waltl]|uniref:N-acetyltransferase domain-containing protein n=1 Tax=Pleurodeles waltl TaxID=8319 RepID=A0AAV7VDW1_PLEWA|nr:hypothetical protein NDU88_002648 [Pleurodeles waltl]
MCRPGDYSVDGIVAGKNCRGRGHAAALITRTSAEAAATPGDGRGAGAPVQPPHGLVGETLRAHSQHILFYRSEEREDRGRERETLCPLGRGRRTYPGIRKEIPYNS